MYNTMCIHFPTLINANHCFSKQNLLCLFSSHIFNLKALLLQLVINNQQEFVVTVLKSCFKLPSMDLYVGIFFL